MHKFYEPFDKERKKAKKAFVRLEELSEHGFGKGMLRKRRPSVEDEDYDDRYYAPE